MLERAINRNIIVPLGTGTGKTYIAVMLLKEMAADTKLPLSEGGKRSVFLVDKVFMFRVLVMTAQILMNMIVHGYISIDLLNVIIFDECHHATKNHPYRQIMSRYKECAGKRPRVLGLTASVVNSHVTGIELKLQMGMLESVMCSSIETTIELESYAKVATKPQIKVRVCKDDTAASWMDVSLRIAAYMKAVETLCKTGDVDSQYSFVESKSFVLEMLSKGRTSLSKIGLWSASRTFLRQELLLKAKLESGILPPRGNFETERLFLKAALCCLQAAIACLKPLVDCVKSVDQLESLVVPRVAELLKCLREYNANASTGDKDAPFCGIIFVTQRYVAYQLKVLLEEVVRLDARTYGFLKVGFIVGQSQQRTVQTGIAAEQCRRQEETLNKFRNKELNLLVATSILEEGIDVPQCNVVIRYDLPASFSSFVQSKGRARMRDAQYIVIIQNSASDNFCKTLKSYVEMEEELIRHQSEATEAWELAYENSTVDSLLPAYYGPPVDGLNGVQQQSVVTLSTSLYVLNRYCMSLPSDRYTVSSAKFEISSFNDSSGFQQYTATLMLPLNCPLKKKITGPPMSNQKLAKMAAALLACKILHKHGELSDHMLPASKYTEAVAGDESREDDDEEFVEFVERKQSSGRYRRELFKKKVPACLSNRLNAGVPLFLCQIQISVAISLLDSPFDELSFDTGTGETFGLLSREPLPQTPKFEIFASEEQVYVKCVSLPQPVLLADDKLALLLEVHRYMFLDLLKFNSPTVTFDFDHSEVPFYVVPLITEPAKGCVIDWALVDKLLWQMRRQNKRPTDEERKNFVYDKTRYVNSIILPWYHKHKDIDNFVRVVAVRKDMNPLSPCDFGGFASFAEYYEKSHNLKIFNLEQPLLCGDYVRPRYSMIHRRVKGDSREAVMIRSDPIAHAYAGSMFVPELVLRCLAVADELRTTIRKEAFSPEDVQSGDDEEAQPIDSHWCRTNGYATRNKRKSVPNESCDGGEPDVGLLVQFEGMNEGYFENVCKSEKANAATPTATEVNSSSATASSCKEFDEEELFFHQSIMPTDSTIQNVRNKRVVLNDDAVDVVDAFFVRKEDFNLVPRSLESAKGEQLTNGGIAEAAVADSSSDVVASFFKQFTTRYRLQPGLREILLALTCPSANDLFDMENAETLGDSFLKYAVAVCMFKKHADKQPGQLSDLRRNEISNANLCKLGKRIGLCGMIIVQEFKPTVNWLPPCFVASELEDDTGLDDDSADVDKNLNLIERHVVSDKRVADCVEALIGVYVRSCGHAVALQFMEWLGLSVICKAEMSEPAVTSAVALEETWKRLQLEKFEHVLRYEFKHRAYLVQALTHSSYCRPAVFENYERMEFLGDAILDYLVTHFIYERELYKSPGLLSDIRSALVNNMNFASIAVKHGYHKYLMASNPALYNAVGNFVKVLIELNKDVNFNTELFILGDVNNPEIDVEEYEVPKVLGDIFESVAGAIYLDSGCSLEVVWQTYYPMMKAQIGNCNLSCYDKSINKTRVKVTVKGGHEFSGMGKSRWLAKNTAAKRALHYLKQQMDSQNVAAIDHSQTSLIQ
ncbi:endoribonuclease Dicer [Trichuris trichiura]|uniref:Endoribonuclease Dicer n=1 Tax=Trichuris trichiura TaxID=36087 RepID=A0A077Z7D5_TRITR|nr:endoribonuclease Dicer [Trichuris trichiura]